MTSIRPTQITDIPTIIELINDSWARTYDPLIGEQARLAMTDKKHVPALFEDEIDMPTGESIVAVDDTDTIVGHIGGFDKGEYGTFFVDHLHIKPEFFGKGVASDLLDSLSEVVNFRAQRIELTVLQGNDRAIGFYKKYGFEPATGTNEDDGLDSTPSILLRYEIK